MKKNNLLIIGAGGHSKVVTEIANDSEWEIAAYLDENLKQSNFLSKPLFKTLEDFKKEFPNVRHAFVALGSNTLRRKWQENLTQNNFDIPCLKHPSAEVSPSAILGAGTLIAAKAVIGPAAVLGEGVIVNTGAILDHDTSIGDFSHLSQGAIVCGGAQIGEEALIGPGCTIEKLATVAPLTHISPNTVIATPQQPVTKPTR